MDPDTYSNLSSNTDTDNDMLIEVNCDSKSDIDKGKDINPVYTNISTDTDTHNREPVDCDADINPRSDTPNATLIGTQCK